MLPLGDENPTRLTPMVNWSIIVACSLVFLWQTSAGQNHFLLTIVNYGLIPARILTGSGYYTFLTNIFLHGGWSHLLGNMLFLAIFGDNIEDCCGHLRYLAFYLVSGMVASAVWMLTTWGAPIPAVGASGAISGVLGAYLILYPTARVRTLISAGLFWRIIRVPAWMMIGLWFLYQLLLAAIPINTGVAYWAHIGGFASGMVLARIIKPKLRRTRVFPIDFDESTL
ncbi:MAG: rhomboid family intramembrane serine protease [Candidatus Bathyarchaeota archaeon]|nr:MAG: rhomboid family intramembrane serine protease [Candidatus Bathyarchaeota archaeon]